MFCRFQTLLKTTNTTLATVCGGRFHGLYQHPVTYRFGINSSGQWSSWFHTSQFTQIVHRKTHYAVLGISETATPKEIKTAYYELSKRWHPDKNKETANEAHQMFLKISEAYSVLGNERKRRDYDRTLLRTGGPSRWSKGSGGFAPGQGSSMHHHRHRNASAFSSTGEYSSAKRSDEQQQHHYRGWQKPDSSSGAAGYQRPQGTYARHSASGGRSYAKSNFEEWERKHYGELKQRAETIGEHARKSAKQERYIKGQITVYRFWELLTAITIVVAFGLAGRQVLYYLNWNSLSSADTTTGGVLATPGGDRGNNAVALRNRKETNDKEKID
ncbi:DnaJ sub A member 3, mitochondrial [Coemansia sp. RSA 1804]|nr:DnaJ sub A member 3, mitochondrial [Coemansia sp. RSA 1804]